jgi:hypothetical protein
MSLGEDRVRIATADSDLVAELKTRVAELIDTLETMKVEGKPELNRCIALAQTCFEDGAMWATKAAG